jgi:hypothetical protein
MNKKNITANFSLLLLTCSLFVLHVIISNLLPEPWNRLNVIFIAAMCALLFQKQTKFIWYIFILSLVGELFHSSPFGLVTGTLFMSLAIMDWVLLNLLTNRFFLIIFVAGFFGMIIYRVFYLTIFFILHQIADFSFSLSRAVIYDFLIEALINAAVLTIIFLIPTLLIKKLNPKYLINR